MCHRISWYYALCSHRHQASTINIRCNIVFQCNYDCGIIETMSLPMFGACASCTKRATLARASPRKTSYGFSPIMEGFEDEVLVESDESYMSGTHSDDSVDELELFDRVTF
ncbi:hypothetical protein BDW74DRAFT_150387 [Aspergillus multicolor]|uniref:uncharacterized protein n=1 Tax=Aspergillus multicolor TaxID=41759 RepID=UPI003CCD66B5